MYSRLKKLDSVYQYLLRAYYMEGVMLGAGRRYMAILTSILG